MGHLWKSFSLIVLIAIFFKTSLATEGKSITEECKNRCERSYPPHTYPKKETHSACLRGCRLSAIDQLSSTNRSKEKASTACFKGCAEGYSDKDCQFACKVGCNEQTVIPTPETLFKEHKMSQGGVWSISGYTRVEPFMVAQQYCHGLIRKITYYMKTSTALYSTTQGGKTFVVRVHGPPQVFAVSNAEKTVHDESQFRVHLEKREQFEQEHHHHFGHGWKAFDKSKAWLHCVSRRSGLPVWLLSAVLFMGFAFLLWLCCSSVGSSSDGDHKEKRLIVDDIFLLDGDELLNKKRPLFKSEEAEPLPLKMNISATTI